MLRNFDFQRASRISAQNTPNAKSAIVNGRSEKLIIIETLSQ